MSQPGCLKNFGLWHEGSRFLRDRGGWEGQSAVVRVVGKWGFFHSPFSLLCLLLCYCEPENSRNLVKKKPALGFAIFNWQIWQTFFFRLNLKFFAEFKVLCCTHELHSVKISEVTIKKIKTLTRNLGDQGEVEDGHGGPNWVESRIPGIFRVTVMYLVFQSIEIVSRISVRMVWQSGKAVTQFAPYIFFCPVMLSFTICRYVQTFERKKLSPNSL